MSNISSLSNDLQNYITHLSTETLEEKINKLHPYELPDTILLINKKIIERCNYIHNILKLYSIYKIRYKTKKMIITIYAIVDLHKFKSKTSGVFNPVIYDKNYIDFFGHYKPINKCILIHYIDIIDLELIQDYKEHIKCKDKYDYKNNKFVLFYTSNIYHFDNYYKYKLGIIVKIYKNRLVINFNNVQFTIQKKNVIGISNSMKFFIDNHKKIIQKTEN